MGPSSARPFRSSEGFHGAVNGVQISGALGRLVTVTPSLTSKGNVRINQSKELAHYQSQGGDRVLSPPAPVARSAHAAGSPWGGTGRRTPAATLGCSWSSKKRLAVRGRGASHRSPEDRGRARGEKRPPKSRAGRTTPNTARFQDGGPRRPPPQQAPHPPATPCPGTRPALGEPLRQVHPLFTSGSRGPRFRK